MLSWKSAVHQRLLPFSALDFMIARYVDHLRSALSQTAGHIEKGDSDCKFRSVKRNPATPSGTQYSAAPSNWQTSPNFITKINYRRALIEEKASLAEFWQLWNKFIIHEIDLFPESSATLQQLNAEKSLHRKFCKYIYLMRQ